MAGAATWTPQRPPADQHDGAAAQAQAGQSSSAPDQSPSAIRVASALNNAATAALIAAAGGGKNLVDNTCAKKAVAELTRD